MRNHLRRAAIGALTVGTITGVTALGLPEQKAAEGRALQAADAIVTAAAVPPGNDPSRGDQWGLSRIKAPQAWARSTGAGVTVAVLDSGVDADHPDLADQLLPGYNTITRADDDGTDTYGHGTQVAGIIAAATGNEVGISGIAPDVKILPVKVLNEWGGGTASDTAAGIVYAVDHGATVINMSFTTTTRAGVLTNAIAYARSKGVVVVAAGGNSRVRGNAPQYPGAEPSVISVAATGSTDATPIYSTMSENIDVAAPGVDVPTTATGGGYRNVNGTSASAAHVSAVAALIKSVRPKLTADQVELVLANSAEDLGDPGKDTEFGWGRVDADAALTVATGTRLPTPVRPASVKPNRVRAIPVIRATNGPTTLIHGQTATVRYVVTAGNKPFAGQTAQLAIAPAGFGFTLTDVITDSNGVIEYSMPTTGRFQIKLSMPATVTRSAANSPTSSFTVKATAGLSAGENPGELVVSYNGTAGLQLRLDRLAGARWITHTTFVPTGGEHTFTGLTAGGKYRVVVPNTTAVTGLISQVAQVA
ncbi:S8 family serine peptidase [Paractinoplanes rishiriensis]|uniref:Peptidase S8/S53 domain-containing protein n=1 Tax=Paractinoplanes rishiriensis TaxID=1050105 RepID=A0A919JTA4_9ACTN|nr:S8 family serine peptidase [Actinoplanes rishiriensis]GIE92929.1 hypothetical protein Ari01nite_03940 [Actinoplanes rishiriensis]